MRIVKKTLEGELQRKSKLRERSGERESASLNH
jgi:hypothetical protein